MKSSALAPSRLPQGSVLYLAYLRPISIPSGASFAVQKLTDLRGTWTTAIAGED